MSGMMKFCLGMSFLNCGFFALGHNNVPALSISIAMFLYEGVKWIRETES